MTSTNKEENLEKLIGEDDFLARYVNWALWLLAIIVVIATVTGQVESFNGLYIWFATHHVTGIWADIAPLAVDSFTVIGELAIFAGIARHWDWQSRIIPWTSALFGLCSSVAANVGDKVQYHSIPTDLTGAIFPLSGAFGLIIGLGVLKRVAKDRAKARELARQTELMPVAVEATTLPEGFKEVENVEAVPALSPVEEAEQIVRDRENLMKKLDEADAATYPSAEELASRAHYAQDREQKGMDVLIPPQPPVDSKPSPWPSGRTLSTHTMDAPTAVPAGVSREEARRRLSDLRPGRQIIDPNGLDPTMTGEQPFTVADVLNYKP